MASKRALVVAGFVVCCGCAAPTFGVAQVAYDTSPLPLAGLAYPYTDESAYAVAHGERPSFVVVPGAYGASPGVAVVARCNYPDGWNVTDFGRDLNGIPPGIEHQCPEPARYGRVRARY